MPDANKNFTLNSLVGAAFGAAGQRCMALSTVVFVGESRKWLPELVGTIAIHVSVQPSANYMIRARQET